jgi:phosphate transport system substrate-binding protein
VAAFVHQTKNSIGYVEYAYVLQKQDDVRPGAEQVRQVHQAGRRELSGGGERRLAEGAGLLSADDRRPREAAYPIAATAFVVMPKKPRDPARSKSAFEFFRWALENGQKQASDLDYVQLPAGLVQQIDGYWKSEFAVTN